jgi:hypothetical protein
VCEDSEDDQRHDRSEPKYEGHAPLPQVVPKPFELKVAEFWVWREATSLRNPGRRFCRPQQIQGLRGPFSRIRCL